LYRATVPDHDHRLHDLLIELVRVMGAWHVESDDAQAALSLSQALALHALDTDPLLSQQDLAARLRLEKSSVSRLVADLERRELLTRERDPENRRLYRLRLTERGRAAHVHLGRGFHRHYDRIAAALTPAEREALVAGIDAFLREVRRS
jgi:DNA-binding MarR family transcriptional regulator